MFRIWLRIEIDGRRSTVAAQGTQQAEDEFANAVFIFSFVLPFSDFSHLHFDSWSPRGCVYRDWVSVFLCLCMSTRSKRPTAMFIRRFIFHSEKIRVPTLAGYQYPTRVSGLTSVVSFNENCAVDGSDNAFAFHTTAFCSSKWKKTKMYEKLFRSFWLALASCGSGCACKVGSTL